MIAMSAALLRAAQFFDLGGNIGGLLLFPAMQNDLDSGGRERLPFLRRALFAGGTQCVALVIATVRQPAVHGGVAVDHGKGASENVGGRTLVFVERNRLRAREAALEFLEGGAGGAAEAEDRLVGIADRKYVALLAREQVRHLDLRHVGVLEFVNQQEARALLFAVKHAWIVAQQADRARDHVTIGAKIPFAQHGFDAGKDARNLLAALQVLGGRDAGGLL